MPALDYKNKYKCYEGFSKIIIVLIISIIILLVFYTLSSKNISSFLPKASTSVYKPIRIETSGVVLKHGQTLSDYWKNQNIKVDLNSKIDGWAFFPNGDQIVVQDAKYWLKKKGSNSWTESYLKSRWTSCSNFPTNGNVDTYSITADTSEEVAFIGRKLFIRYADGSCRYNGEDWYDDWEKLKSPAGNFPWENGNTKLDAYIHIDKDNHVAIVNDKMYIVGSSGKNSLCPDGYKSDKPWQFCNTETLKHRW